MPAVYNKYKGVPKGAVYIGRPSPYGNPFSLGKDGSRDEVYDKFEQYIKSKPEFIKLVKENLKGKDLVCFCKPERCHGDTLIEIANS